MSTLTPHSHLRHYAFRALAGVLLLAAALPGVAQAQVGTSPSAIAVAAPDTATLGQTILLQARLVGAGGAPLAKATVLFVVPQTFLHVSGDEVVAQGVTDDTGLVKAQWQVRSSGDLAVTAQYRGDASHGPASASATISVAGSRQLYVQDAGVRIPLLNSPPLAMLGQLWPRASGWPIALALLIVWSLYARVVTLLLKIARDPSEGSR